MTAAQPIREMRAALHESVITGKRPDYEGIGALLQGARESHDIAIVDAAAAIRVKPAIITAIEKGALSEIPGGSTYAKGYLRMYASFLGVNIDTMLQLVTPEARVKKVASVSSGKQEPLRIRAAVMLSLAIGIGLLVAWQFHERRVVPTKSKPVELVRPLPETLQPLLAEDALPQTDIFSSPCVLAPFYEGWPPCYADESGQAEYGQIPMPTILRLDEPVYLFAWLS